MIDVGRFMQDNVGVKTRKYEQTIVSGNGTFVANGKIVFAVGTGYQMSGAVPGRFWGTTYLATDLSTEAQVLLSGPQGTSVGLVYDGDKTITYSSGSIDMTRFLIVSEKA